MNFDRKVLAVIPARGGSKGVPRKNIRYLHGKPLIAWTIEAAQNSHHIDRVVVSTEDVEIASAARNLGADVPFLRPASLAEDNTPGIAPVLHALECITGYDDIVLLQPTSPLRTSDDIDGCLEWFYRKKAPACVSVVEASHSPYWMYSLDDESRMEPLLQAVNPILRRQDAPKTYLLNGAVYVANVDWLMQHKTFLSAETIGYRMEPEHSLDIDHEIDLVVAEYLLRKRDFPATMR